jgi:F-type H+-transporting ATPase subunit b
MFWSPTLNYSYRALTTVVAVLALMCGVATSVGAAAPTANDGEVAGDVAEKGASHAEHGDHIGEAGVNRNVEQWKADLAIWTFCVFLLLMFILGKFAWRPISEALERREQKIAENIASAERVADEARLLLADYERKLSGAADEVRGMLEEARRDAEHTRQQIVAEARVAAKEEHDRAIRDVNTAKDQALKELAEKSTNIAIDLAGKIVQAKLNKADHMALVQDAMGRFASSAPSAS